MTVAGLLACISSAELTEWWALEEVRAEEEKERARRERSRSKGGKGIGMVGLG